LESQTAATVVRQDEAQLYSAADAQAPNARARLATTIARFRVIPFVIASGATFTNSQFRFCSFVDC
jgi:hypothetical protein